MNDLILGWKVNNDNHPEYWLNKNNRYKDRETLEKNLVLISPKNLKTHSVIFGQSGSAKTSFLARIIEELSLKTKANIVILDANADFSFLKNVKPVDFWNRANYDISNRTGSLPHEKKRSDFSKIWKKSVKNKIANFSSSEIENNDEDYYKIYWPNFPISAVISGLDTFEDMQMERFHKYVCFIYDYFEFIKLLEKEYNFKTEKRTINSFEKSIEIYNDSIFSIRFASEEYKRDWAKNSLINDVLDKLNFHDDIIKATNCILEKHKNYEIPEREEVNDFTDLFFGFLKYTIKEVQKKVNLSDYDEYLDLKKKVTRIQNNEIIKRMEFFANRYKELYLKFLSEIVEEKIIELYKNIYYKYKETGIITNLRPTPFVESNQINIMNLISYSNNEIRNILIFDILKTCWSHSMTNWRNALTNSESKFQPIFIVIEEAHNVIPANPSNEIQKKIIELSRTIANEGRKFNIFFLLVTQRPDKLDKFILSECQNKAFMRLESKKLITEMKDLISIEDNDFHKIIEKCPSFHKSRVFLTGKWLQENQIFYAAARRTVKGGVEIDDEYWATL